jgi:hypothetical protein
MKRTIYNLLLLVLFFSCKYKAKVIEKNNETKNTDSSKYINTVTLTPYLDTIDYSKFKISYIGKPDTFEADIPAFYIDTFSLNNSKFRIIHRVNDPNNDATLEKFTNGQWFRRIEFDKFNGSGEITHNIDVNNDGYIDILRDARFFQEIYLYNPSIENFIDSSCGQLNTHVFLLDTLHNIYCDFQEYRQHCNTIFSSLYTFKNFKKVYLFRLDLDNCKNGSYSKIEKMVLYKCLFNELYPHKKLKTILLEKPLDPEQENYFDNKQFWKKQYKRLLGYS